MGRRLREHMRRNQLVERHLLECGLCARHLRPRIAVADGRPHGEDPSSRHRRLVSLGTIAKREIGEPLTRKR